MWKIGVARAQEHCVALWNGPAAHSCSCSSQWAAERETAVQWQALRNYFFHYFDISFFLTTQKVNAGHGRTKCDCHLQASSALLRSLSGSASSQSRMVLISFPLSQSSSSRQTDKRTDRRTDIGRKGGGVTVRYDCVYLQPLSPLDRTTSQWRPVGFRPMTPITFSLTYCLEKQEAFRLRPSDRWL